MDNKPNRIAVPSFAQKRVSTRDDKSLQIQSYDFDNIYPQRIRNAVNSSGTGTSCTNLYAKHLRGRGFKNEDLEKLVVNEKNQTLGDVHKLICYDKALYNGFAIHIGYNALMQVTSIKHIPFEFVRLSLADDRGVIRSCKIYSDWAKESGKAFDKSKVKEVDLYTDDPEMMYHQINGCGGFENWNGHILYYSDKGNNIYPYASCDSVFEDVLTDAGIKMWKYRGISNDFMANYFWIFNGEFANDIERNDYVNSLNSFQGVDNSHKIVVVECPVPNSKPEIVKIDKQDNDKVYELTETSCVENIIRSYGQPKALHSISVSGSLGLTKEIEEGKIVYDERTSDEREKLGVIFKSILNNWYEGNPALDLDYSIVALTGNTDVKEVKSISETLEVGKLQTMQMIVTDSLMTSEQKVNFLVAVFGIDFNLALAIVNGTTLPSEYIS